MSGVQGWHTWQMAAISHHLNELNTRMQGRNENLLTSTDKINGFRSKVQLWQQHVKTGNYEMFPLSNKWQDINFCWTV